MRKKLNTDRLRLELSRARVPFMYFIGLVAIGVFAFGVIFNYQTFQRPWKSYYKVRASFDDVKGVVPGKQEVRISGIKVGVITKSQLINGRPVLTLSLEKKFAPVYKNAHFQLRPVTPLDDMYVAIKRGTPSAGKLSEKDIVPADQTVTPVDISRVLQTFNDDTRTHMTALLNQFGKGLQGNGENLKWAFNELAPFLQTARDVSQALSERRVALQRLVHNFGALSTELGSHDKQLAGLVNNGEATLGELAARDVPLSQTIAAIPGTLDNLRGAMANLKTVQTSLDPALTKLLPVADALPSSLAALRTLGITALPAVRALEPASQRLVPLARDLSPTADSLSSALARLRVQAPSYDKLTQDTEPCLDVIRQFFSNTPSVTKYGNAHGAYPRGDIALDVGSAGGISAHGLTKTSSCTGGK
jgi:phospholipid/cholesterol/gamma-HCH transport system substrate-binding protein